METQNSLPLRIEILNSMKQKQKMTLKTLSKDLNTTLRYKYVISLYMKNMSLTLHKQKELTLITFMYLYLISIMYLRRFMQIFGNMDLLKLIK